MSYRTRRDLEFVVGSGSETVVCPAGTTLEAVPEGALSYVEAVHFQRMVKVEALRNPNVRLVATRWNGKMRVLAIGDHLEAGPPGRRVIAVGTMPPLSPVTTQPEKPK